MTRKAQTRKKAAFSDEDEKKDASLEATTQEAAKEETIEETEESKEAGEEAKEAEEETGEEAEEETVKEALKTKAVLGAVKAAAVSDRSFDDSKTDVWDFGAENLGDAYNNRLDVATLNSFNANSNIEPGSTGVSVGDFSIDGGDFSFNAAGKTSHRIRTTNTEVTRYDEKSLVADDGTSLSGYLYSNIKASTDVYLSVACQADDTMTYYVSSNGTESTLVFENESDSTDKASDVFNLGSGKAKKMVFYPAATSKYKLYSIEEKLVVARVYREHAKYSVLSGSVSGFDGTGSFDIVFTNTKNGNEVKATVSDGNYSAVLAQGFEYKMSLEGADEYIITSDSAVSISGDTTMDVAVSAVELVSVKGNLEFVYGAGMPEGFEKKP